MASLNIKKMKAGSLAGMAKHFDSDLRKRLNHSNNDIDKSMTNGNSFINCESFKDGLSKINDCIKKTDEVNPPKRVKADRVTMAAINIPIPEEISKIGKECDFAKKAVDYLKSRLKVPEAIGFLHIDEKHTYVDPLTHEERMSLAHVHCFIPTYTEEYGINAKNFFGTSKLNYAKLNKDFDNFVKENYGINYMNNNESLGMPVEVLKTLSERTEKHDDKLKAELGVHREILEKGSLPEIEHKTSFHAVKLSEEEFTKIQNDIKYKNGLRAKVSELNRTILTMNKEKDTLIEEYENRLSRQGTYVKTLEKNIEIRDEAIKMFCDNANKDYDEIINAINRSLALGHEKDYKKAIASDYNNDKPYHHYDR